MSRRMQTSAVVVLGAVLAGSLSVVLTGCATLGLPEIQPLEFRQAPDRASTVRLLPPSSSRPIGGLALRLWVDVANPNPVGLTLSELTGTLFLEGEEGPEADFPLGLPLDAGQDTVIPLDLSLSFEGLPDLTSAVRSAVTEGAMDYRLEGEFGVRAGRIGPTRFGPTTLVAGTLDVRSR